MTTKHDDNDVSDSDSYIHEVVVVCSSMSNTSRPSLFIRSMMILLTVSICISLFSFT